MKRFATARRLLTLGQLVAALALALPARGQDSAEPPSEEGTAAADYNPTVDEHTVEPGDTLWDLCAKITGSPWQWPRVWSYNPEITNPHWIFPGDVVRFHPSDQELPRLVDLVAGKREMPEEPKAEPEPKKTNAVDVVQGAPIRQRARQRGLVAVFVTQRELAESGTLTNAVQDKILLATHDDVFITWPRGKKAAPGQRYMVFRTAREVRHPVSGERWGYMTEVTGFASIQSNDDDISRARLDETLVEVERGQLVAPAVELPRLDPPPKPAGRAVAGYILAVEPLARSVAGKNQVVFIDIGKDAGLEVGNRLAVYQHHDPADPDEDELPWVEVGRLLLVDVKDRAATALVVGSRIDLRPGMPVRAITQP